MNAMGQIPVEFELIRRGLLTASDRFLMGESLAHLGNKCHELPFGVLIAMAEESQLISMIFPAKTVIFHGDFPALKEVPSAFLEDFIA